MPKRNEIIHCDNCGCVTTPCEKFCSWCGRERICFAWQPVPIGSEAWIRREAMGREQQYGPLVFLHCDKCFSVLNQAADNFCGYCRKPVKDIAWKQVPLSSFQWRRRELLRRQHEKKEALRLAQRVHD